MMLISPWVTFAVFAGIGLLGYNLCAKLGGGNLPPVIFASVMYAAGFLSILPIFLFYMKDKNISFLSSLPLTPVMFAAFAGVAVILVDTSVASMFGKGAPMGLGTTFVSIISLSLTLIVGFVFLNEKYAMINVMGLVLALVSVPLMLYSSK